MNAALPTPGRRGTTSLATCIAVVAVPLLAVVAALSVLQTRDQVPGLTGSFAAQRWVVWTCLAASAVVAGSLALGLSRLGPHWELPGSHLVFVSLGIWFGGFLVLVIGVCGALNRAMGDVTRDSGRVQARYETKGKGCHHALDVVGPSVPSGMRVCVEATRWQSLREGDSVTMARVESDLGEQIGLLPAAAASGAEVAR